MNELILISLFKKCKLTNKRKNVVDVLKGSKSLQIATSLSSPERRDASHMKIHKKRMVDCLTTRLKTSKIYR